MAMIKLKRTTEICWRMLLKPFIVLGLVLLMLFLVFLARIAYKPLSLTEYSEQIKKLFLPEDSYIDFEQLYIYFDGSLSLYAHKPEFAISGQSFKAEKIRFEFSKRYTLTLRPAFKHIEIESPYAYADLSVNNQLDKDKEKVDTLPESQLVSSFFENKFQVPMYKGQSFLDLFSGQQGRFWKALRTINITDGRIELDTKDGTPFFVDNLNVHFSKNFLYGQQLSINADVVEEDVSFPYEVLVTHSPRSERVKVNVKVDSLNLNTFHDEIGFGEDFKVSGIYSVNGHFYINEQNKLEDMKMNLSGRKSYFDIFVYSHPLKFESWKATMSLSDDADGKIKLDHIRAVDHQGLEISGYAHLTGLAKRLGLDAQLTLSELDLNQAFHYIPDLVAGQTRSWLEGHITKSETEEVYLTFKGDFLDFPFEGRGDDAKGLFRVESRIKTAILSYMDKMPPLEEIKANFLLENDYIKTDVVSAKTRRQNLTFGKVELTNLYKRHYPELSLSTEVAGKVQDLLDLLMYILPDTGGLIGDVAGKHASTFALSLPLKNDIYYEDLKFTAAAKIEEGALVPPYIGALYKSPQSDLLVTEEKLEYKGKGYLNTQPVDVVWKENIKAFGEETFVEVISDIDQKTIEKTLEEEALPFELEGTALAKLQLNKAEKNYMDYKLFADLTTSSLQIKDLNWRKEKDLKSFIESTGKLTLDGQTLIVNEALLRAPETEVRGKAKINLMTGYTHYFDFAPIKIGQSDFVAAFKENEFFKVTGDKLDLRLFDSNKKASSQKQKQKFFDQNIDVDVALKKVLTAGGALNDLSLKAKKLKGYWESAKADALTNKEHKVSLTLERNTKETRILKAHAENAGDFLKALDLYPNLRDGALDLQFNLLDVRDPVDKEALQRGNGYLEISNSHLVKAPILAKILSLLSLEQIANLDKGIIFERIAIPLHLKNSIIISKDIRLEGPSMAIKGRALVNTEAEKIDVEGTLVPISTLNKSVNAIPIVGDILTGSQDALFAAEFSFSGDLNNPKVAVNPLSAVTPGIIKDLVGVLNKYGAISQDAYEDWNVED